MCCSLPSCLQDASSVVWPQIRARREVFLTARDVFLAARPKLYSPSNIAFKQTALISNDCASRKSVDSSGEFRESRGCDAIGRVHFQGRSSGTISNGRRKKRRRRLGRGHFEGTGGRGEADRAVVGLAVELAAESGRHLPAYVSIRDAVQISAGGSLLYFSGALRTRNLGFSTSPSAKTTAALAKITAPKTWPASIASRALCSSKIRQPKSASHANATCEHARRERPLPPPDPCRNNSDLNAMAPGGSRAWVPRRNLEKFELCKSLKTTEASSVGC